MFLSEKLLIIGRKWDGSIKDASTKAEQMIGVCATDLECVIMGINSRTIEVDTLRANLKRIIRTWEKVCVILDNEGFQFLNHNGFRYRISQTECFNHLNF